MKSLKKNDFSLSFFRIYDKIDLLKDGSFFTHQRGQAACSPSKKRFHYQEVAPENESFFDVLETPACAALYRESPYFTDSPESECFHTIFHQRSAYVVR